MENKKGKICIENEKYYIKLGVINIIIPDSENIQKIYYKDSSSNLKYKVKILGEDYEK